MRQALSTNEKTEAQELRNLPVISQLKVGDQGINPGTWAPVYRLLTTLPLGKRHFNIIQDGKMDSLG